MALTFNPYRSSIPISKVISCILQRPALEEPQDILEVENAPLSSPSYPRNSPSLDMEVELLPAPSLLPIV
jgi:hypothetical protein